jgi:hypothetical protein
VHVHPHRLALALLAVASACRTPTRSTTELTSAREVPKVAVPGGADLCRGRGRCAVVRRRSVTGLADTSLVETRIAHDPGATADEDRCDRREYWVLRPSGNVLLATDCEVQWGADNPGPARVTVRGTLVDVVYVELQSSDRCERYAATVSLDPAKLTVTEGRTIGTVERNVCRVGKEAAPAVPLGDGSADHPLLMLHP